MFLLLMWGLVSVLQAEIAEENVPDQQKWGLMPPMCCSSGNGDELPGQALSSLWILVGAVRAAAGDEMEGKAEQEQSHCKVTGWLLTLFQSVQFFS